MSASTPTPTIISTIQTYLGGALNKATTAGNSAITAGTVATSGSVYGVPILTISMIAITSFIMAYVTMGDPAGESTEFGIPNLTGSSNSDVFSGGKGRRSRKSGSRKRRVATQKKRGK